MMTQLLSARPFPLLSSIQAKLATHRQTVFRATERPKSRFFSRSITGLIATLSLSQAVLAAPVFINEFHYDNDGTDSDEGLEIAAVAGTNLENWQLLFYNGSNGEVYKSLELNGVMSDLDNGFGTLGFATSGIQNGPADAFALVNDQGEVFDFISYEGSLTATNGPAIGLTSIDVGLVELPDSPIGLSIQRQGSGSKSEDFYWAIDTASLGDVNNGQSFQVSPVPLPASLWLFSTACIGLLGRQRAIHKSHQQDDGKQELMSAAAD
ncbi:hypothetical protein N9F42_04745 [Pseudomonadales bacterium]|nr:hypothetical protein [Pseudomonadales bacterium]